MPLAGFLNYTEIFCLKSLLKGQNRQNCYPHECCIHPHQRNTIVRKKGKEEWKGLIGLLSKALTSPQFLNLILNKVTVHQILGSVKL